ncbi:MAG: hypothetical protein Fur0025_01630 [Oscillatoriaceae cyanobacterium]
MNNFGKFWLPLTVAAVGMGAMPSAANAFGLSYIDNDDDFNALTPQLSFVAEGRIGNNAGNGTHELNFHGINLNNPTATSDEKNFTWSNSVATSFRLTYDAATRNVTYLVGGLLLQATANQNPVRDIFIRTRATIANSSITIANLLLNGVSINRSLSVSGGGSWESGMEYLRLSGIQGSFTLEGTSTMAWGNTRPTNSNLAYQIKVGTAVPEPTTMLGFALGASGLAMIRKRRHKQPME